MDGLRYYLKTYGCQKNEYDSEVLAALLHSMGYAPAGAAEEAHLIVLNTCSVRNNADEKVYGRLGHYKRLKGGILDPLIIVTGCLAQKDGESLLRRFAHVDVVLGTRNLDRLPQAIDYVRTTGLRYNACEMRAMDFESLRPLRSNAFSAWIPVSEGCNCHCTFCIVPRVRGAMTSREPSAIIGEVKEFAAAGGKEVTLLGQNVNAYGSDLPSGIGFAGLLEEVNRLEGLSRIRFTSPHPANFSAGLIEKLASLDKVCEVLHLPLQSGDDKVLRRMGRTYTTAMYRDLVASLRGAIPGLSLTTDIIVGFPGEEEGHFRNTLAFVEEMAFDSAFMFAYSEREGTAAVKMKDAVPPPVRMERLHELVGKQNDISLLKNMTHEGAHEEVLVESISRKKKSVLTGRTRRNKVVNFEGTPDLIGEIVQVKLKKAYTWGFMGEKL
ncbi:MAG: tRNA (N6-isopentenyl adenosine(37)-C2)-methylthiotransferase MiaB [Candidatus Eremiobacteraeota bacterium]|nr:tRNA (N6-isopentenyl adenosine(37)-C2)-methylthiotransferase MiaB [Candidatus Eremiobacteraeota bacterium]